IEANALAATLKKGVAQVREGGDEVPAPLPGREGPDAQELREGGSEPRGSPGELAARLAVEGRDSQTPEQSALREIGRGGMLVPDDDAVPGPPFTGVLPSLCLPRVKRSTDRTGRSRHGGSDERQDPQESLTVAIVTITATADSTLGRHRASLAASLRYAL